MSTENSNAYEPPDASSATADKPQRLFPGFWPGFFIAIDIGLIVLVRRLAPDMDYAIVNIITLIIAFIAAMTLLGWFVFRSTYPVALRALVPVLLMVAVGAFASQYRLDETRGDLIPVFRRRSEKKPDQLLNRVTSNSSEGDVAKADLKTTTPQDFSRFLGPNSTMSVEGAGLSRDWENHPPTLRWRQKIGAGWSAFSVVNGYAVTMEQRGDEELVTCYSAETGKLIWANGINARHDEILGGVGPRSTPTIHNGKVYALGATGVFRCLDGQTGEELWTKDLYTLYGTDLERDLTVIFWGRANSPLIVDEMVIIPAGGPPGGKFVSLLALNKETGEQLWEGGDTQVSYSSPVFATLCGVPVVLCVNESNVTGHVPETGEELWRFPWPGSSAANANVSQVVVLPGDKLLTSKAYGEGGAVWQASRDAAGKWNVTEEWHKPNVLKTKFSNAVVRDGHAFALSDGILECVDLATGKAKWKRGRYGHGQILGVDDLLLVQSEVGDIYLVPADPTGHQELGQFHAMDGKCWNNLCLYGKLLLVRSGEEAACYELP